MEITVIHAVWLQHQKSTLSNGMTFSAHQLLPPFAYFQHKSAHRPQGNPVLINICWSWSRRLANMVQSSLHEFHWTQEQFLPWCHQLLLTYPSIKEAGLKNNPWLILCWLQLSGWSMSTLLHLFVNKDSLLKFPLQSPTTLQQHLLWNGKANRFLHLFLFRVTHPSRVQKCMHQTEMQKWTP